MSLTVADELQHQFKSIFASSYPSFVYIQDLSGANVAREAITRVVLAELEASGTTASKPAVVFVDCIACFSQRLLFDTILNELVSARPSSRKPAADAVRNDSIDNFLHNLRDLFREGPSTKQESIVIVFEHVEKMKEMNPRLVHPLSRLQELVSYLFQTWFREH